MSVYQLGSGHSLYDAWNRMVCVHADSGTAGRTLDGGDALVATYQYDGRNRRVAKLLPATGGNFKRTDYYYNENWQVLEERYIASVSGTATAATAASRKMLWDARYIDAPVWQWAASACYYYTTDANMNVTTWVLSGGTGPYVRYEYDPYGLPRQLDAGTWNRTSSADVSKTETLYCGYRYDPETGLLQARERYYHPTLGRWGQWDKSGYVSRLNLYEYCRSAPAGYADFSGDDPVATSGPATGPSTNTSGPASAPGDHPATAPTSGPTSGPASEPAQQGWTRALQLGPQWLGDGDPDYVIDIFHNVPQAPPAGATQLWQVVTCNTTYMYLDDKDPTKCMVEAQTRYILDVVDIGGRRRIPDRLAWVISGRQVCYAIEMCFHKAGFDDGKNKYEQGSPEVTQALANKISNAMRPPIERFIDLRVPNVTRLSLPMIFR
jgi:RHS repeat-associated protein